jgi:hypothetical protein
VGPFFVVARFEDVSVVGSDAAVLAVMSSRSPETLREAMPRFAPATAFLGVAAGGAKYAARPCLPPSRPYPDSL